MCIAIYKPEGKVLPIETLKECYTSNPDGAGLCMQRIRNYIKFSHQFLEKRTQSMFY